MDIPPPNSTTLATTLGPKPKLHQVVCTIVCDDATVTFTYRRGDRPAHFTKTYERTDPEIQLELDRLVVLDE